MVINTRLDWEQWGKRRIPLPPSYPPLLSKITNASSFEVLSPLLLAAFYYWSKMYPILWNGCFEKAEPVTGARGYFQVVVCARTHHSLGNSLKIAYIRGMHSCHPLPLPHNGWKPCKMLQSFGIRLFRPLMNKTVSVDMEIYSGDV